MRSLYGIARLFGNRCRRSVCQTPQTRRRPWPRQRRKPTRSRARSTSHLKGVRDGDAAKVREAFHPDAHMWDSMAGQRYHEPVAELIAMVDGKPVDVDGSFHAQITSVEQTDDAASVTLTEEGFWGGPSSSWTSARWRGSTARGRSSTRPSSTPAGSRLQIE
jgi:hypothetical protein